MADLIDRQAAIDALGNAGLINYAATGSSNGLIHAMNVIKGLPAAQPQRMRGRWVPVTNGRGGFECDQCHNYAPSYQNGVERLSAFCPSCGARMVRGEQDDRN